MDMNLFNFVSISDLMKIGSGYGIIQVLAQDFFECVSKCCHDGQKG